MSLPGKTTGAWHWLREPVFWGAAGVIALAAHLSIGYGIASFAPVAPPAALEEAMVVELAPLVLSTAEPVETEAVEEEQPEIVSELQEQPPAEIEESVDEPEPELTETPEAEPEQPEEVAEAEPVEEVPEEVQPEEEPIEEVAPTPEVKSAAVVLPQPKKPPPRKVEKKPEPKRVVKKPEPPKKAAPVRKAEKPAASRPAEAARPRAAQAPKVNPSRWYAQVQSAVARRKPSGRGERGRVVIRFVVNSAGAIVSASIARSSGKPALDSAALSMARGARVPAPPEGLGRSSFPFTIPVDFR